MNKFNHLISLSELAAQLGIAKSKLHYYVKQGIMTPEGTISNLIIFDRSKAVKQYERILELKKQLSLHQIKKII